MRYSFDDASYSIDILRHGYDYVRQDTLSFGSWGLCSVFFGTQELYLDKR